MFPQRSFRVGQGCLSVGSFGLLRVACLQHRTLIHIKLINRNI